MYLSWSGDRPCTCLGVWIGHVLVLEWGWAMYLSWRGEGG